MLSKARIKYIKSLQIKKYRKQEQRFVAEGEKCVVEVLKSDFVVDWLVVTESFAARHATLLHQYGGEVMVVEPRQLSGLGELKTNESALAVVRMKPNEPMQVKQDKWLLVLDDIRDPGNLGTLLRIADWYGVEGIVASNNTADLYNGKVIQATMGSFTRVRVWYTALPAFLAGVKVPILGAFLKGEDVHGFRPPAGGLLVIGNESSGISDDVARHVMHRVTIPRYGRAESLNAAVAAAVLLDNLVRSK